MKRVKKHVIASCEAAWQSRKYRTCRIVILGALMVFIVGCNTLSNNNDKTYLKLKIATKHCELSPFKSIVLSGDAKVELVNGSYGIDVTGLQDGYNWQNSLMNQVLYVKGDASINVIKITAPELKNITVTDNARVSSKDFSTRNLTIIAKGNGEVNLEGRLNVGRIFQFSNGRMNISWIDSDRLFLSGHGSGPIYLAGIADDVVVKLVKNSFLNARYLRTQKASVFTVNSARAEVLVIDDLDAFAIDKSSIYYYKRPEQLTVVTRASGNVLQPGWIR